MLKKYLVSSIHTLVTTSMGLRALGYFYSKKNMLRDNSQLIPVDDHKLYVESHGQGEAMVFLHGGFSNCEQWRRYIPHFVKDYNIILIDSPGHGRSSLGKGSLSYAQMAIETLRVLDALGIKTAHFVGHSDGAAIVLHLLSQHPQRAISGTIIGTPFHVDNYGDKYNLLKQFFRDLKAKKGRAYAFAFHSMFQPFGRKPEEFQALVHKLEQTWLNEPQFSAEELKTIKRKALVFKCNHDEFLAPGVFDQLADLIPESKLAYIPEGKHHMPITHVSEVSLAITEFIENLTEASAAGA